jgi:mannose-1-phosphate guanylyltransferase / mannose-6-phosphate isomerase
MNTIRPIILAGGGGMRLWPLSRDLYPKQFLSFGDEHSMLQLTLKRLEGLEQTAPRAAPLAICNEEHRFLIEEHAEQIGWQFDKIILEPEGRNTAPALTMAALLTAAEDPVLLMMPADHLIRDVPAFHNSVAKASRLAEEGWLICFGIKPDRPETGFGYIQRGVVLDGQNPTAARIERFVEKPDHRLAEQYVGSGDYYWNSGMFMMRASIWLKAVMYYQPGIYAACARASEKGTSDSLFFRPDRDSFLACPADSVDYSVMEKIGADSEFRAGVVELDAGWSDIGSWSAVWSHNPKDEHENVLLGDVIATSTRKTYISSNDRLVAAIGCEDLVIVETADAVLIVNRHHSQDVKKVTDKLREHTRPERIMHTRVYRPWGSFESLDQGEQYQVKRLTVKPGKKLSLQLHHQRSEHWVVVRGVATVTCGDQVSKLKANESTYIPKETKHRLANDGAAELEVIEVQSGAYLGEDDIVRFEDDFGRN